jgi:hypothetical protein
MIDIKTITDHIRNNQPFSAHNFEIFEILEGDLFPRLVREVRTQLLSDRSFSVAQKLIPPINIIKRLTEKLTQIYTRPPVRTASKESDQILIDYYVNFANVNSSMEECNRFYNSQKVGAVEPFLTKKNEPMIRPLSGHQFLPYSDDLINPLEQTAFIKFIGNYAKNGQQVPVYFIYTDTEFLAIDGEGQRLDQYMVENGGENPYQIIPQAYARKTKNLLLPKPDTDLLKMGLLAPAMLTHLNFAIKMQTHSIIYGIDVDSTNLEFNPDSFVSFKSDIGGNRPEIGTIKPQVDIAEVQSYVFGLLNMWFETRGLRPGESQGNQNSLSGIAMMIKEMDISADYAKQSEYFQKVEKDFWYRLSKVHNYWVDSGKLQGMPYFSDEFEPSIEFQTLKPNEDLTSIVDNQIKLVREALTSRKRARQIIHKDLDGGELEELETEIAEEFGVADEGQQGSVPDQDKSEVQ